MAAVREVVRKLIADNTVMIFSKSYCPFCMRAKSIFDDMRVRYNSMELDEEDKGPEIQEHLRELTGQSTVPNVFIRGRHVGGCSDVEEKRENGQLAELLREKMQNKI
ncbi:uncharacterized protein VTP21DRAFT_4422 [Calcarisporiella thermophila]|uniref:uncharacterized protein n=1 Tax=Calcarisporiella thermophila TaxID=911321 RepID=UPI0037437715